MYPCSNALRPMSFCLEFGELCCFFLRPFFKFFFPRVNLCEKRSKELAKPGLHCVMVSVSVGRNSTNEDERARADSCAESYQGNRRYQGTERPITKGDGFQNGRFESLSKMSNMRKEFPRDSDSACPSKRCNALGIRNGHIHSVPSISIDSKI